MQHGYTAFCKLDQFSADVDSESPESPFHSAAFVILDYLDWHSGHRLHRLKHSAATFQSRRFHSATLQKAAALNGKSARADESGRISAHSRKISLFQW